MSPKFLSNPTLADFPHLLKADAKQVIREKIRIDLPNGIIETDTPVVSRLGILMAGRAISGGARYE